MKRIRLMPEQPTRDMIEAARPVILATDLSNPVRVRRALHAIYQEMRALAPSPPTAGLTSHQRRFQEFVADYITANRRSPTYPEIADYMGFNDRTEAFKIALALEAKGVINRGVPGQHRNISLRVWPGQQLPKKIKSIYRKSLRERAKANGR